jgi:hypothetical protein
MIPLSHPVPATADCRSDHLIRSAQDHIDDSCVAMRRVADRNLGRTAERLVRTNERISLSLMVLVEARLLCGLS